ncbi:MAG: CAAX prenyl protease-related protein [Verrucomicrobia bacterium]|nr:CAAX prenyl protease-related protein [Verrucomicrobiota bacterium]
MGATPIKSLIGAVLLWWAWPFVTEMRWKFSIAAVLVGVGVLAIWVGLDSLVPKQQELWMKLGLSKPPEKPPLPWNPFFQFGEGSALGWFFVGARILGSTLVVPPLEEAFYRSFMYRWIAKPDFQSVSLGQFSWKPFALTALIFGFAHNEWLAGILCSAAYQGLVCWKKNLGEAMTAHAITNCLLGIYIVARNEWHFW